MATKKTQPEHGNKTLLLDFVLKCNCINKKIYTIENNNLN